MLIASGVSQGASVASRVLGVAATQRVSVAPQIPTFVEQGLPNYVAEGWFAVIGPKGLPMAEVKRIRDAVAQAFADPVVIDTMNKQGNVISVSTPEYAAQFFKSEMAKYAALVKLAGVELQ